MKNNKSVTFLTIFIATLFIQITCMENNSLIPYARFTTKGRSGIVIKDNTFALMQPKCVRVWNLNTLSNNNKIPSHEYNCLTTTDEAYRFIDLNHNGTQLLLLTQNQLIPSNTTIRIHQLLTNLSFHIDVRTNKEVLENIFAVVPAVKFVDTNIFITADENATYSWQPEQKQPTIISMPIPTHCTGIPIIATQSTSKSYAYYKNVTAINTAANTIKEKYLFTTQNYQHLYFILFALRNLALPQDLIREVVSTIRSSPIQQINTETIHDDISWMEYSPDGYHIALKGQNNTYICKTHGADMKTKNCITTIPIAGFSTFHPNNKTLFIITNDGKAIHGIDLKTKKTIYKHRLTNKILIDAIPGEHNQLLAFNASGDKLAVAFYGHCQVYDVPKSLNNFLNTYDPETIDSITTKPEKKYSITVKKSDNKIEQQINCLIQ